MATHAHLLILPGPHPTYEDGDILCAMNRRRIRCSHAERICHVKHAGFNSSGLRPIDSLPDMFQQNTYELKTERIGPNQFRKTRLADGENFEFEADVEHLDFDGKLKNFSTEFISNAVRHLRHRIFGTAGSEYWYGGRTNASMAKLDTIWQEIEARSPHREADFPHWPFTRRELSRFLAISTDDFDDATAGILTAPLVDETDPDNPVTVKKRKNKSNWRRLQNIVEADVLDFSKRLDVRAQPYVRGDIVQEKTR